MLARIAVMKGAESAREAKWVPRKKPAKV